MTGVTLFWTDLHGVTRVTNRVPILSSVITTYDWRFGLWILEIRRFTKTFAGNKYNVNAVLDVVRTQQGNLP